MSTNFPAMGEFPLTEGLVNISGDRSANTIPVARKGPSGDVLATGGTAHRGSTSMNGEHNGPTFRPVTTLPFQPDPQTGRGMRTVPSAVGNRDFWTARQGSDAGKVIK